MSLCAISLTTMLKCGPSPGPSISHVVQNFSYNNSFHSYSYFCLVLSRRSVLYLDFKYGCSSLNCQCFNRNLEFYCSDLLILYLVPNRSSPSVAGLDAAQSCSKFQHKHKRERIQHGVRKAYRV